METGLRIVLLLVAFFILAGIVWDAFISRRKKSNVYKRNKSIKSNREKFKKAKALFGREGSRSSHKNDPFAEYSQNPFNDDYFDEDDPLKPELGEDLSSSVASEFQRGSVNHQRRNEDFQRNASQSDFEDVILVKPNAAKEPKLELPKIEAKVEQVEPKKIPEDVMILNLMARQPGVFGGRKMLEAFQEAYLYFGEMNIFHRHENMDGSGQIIFSLASAVEPGIFQISKMETFVTPGLTLFFVLEKPNQSIAAFELMLRTAKQLAMRLDGELKDSQHKYLTLPTIEKYREMARNAGMKVALG